MITVIKILTNKNTYIILFVLIICSYILFLNINLQSKNKKIDDLKIEIDSLNNSNSFLYKDLVFKEKQINIIKSFSNSTTLINKMTNEVLDNETKYIVDTIKKDFYSSFN
ncbi:hypothetical protein [Brachyspira pilosicoli]|uniref:hypothetical protein n=1 Tax=Brachyspira pilosicoli TaxID=52584 RepID=UPI00300526AF